MPTRQVEGMQNMAMTTTGYRVAALYHFARLDHPEKHRQPLLDLCRDADIRGTLLLAAEGINGTIAGPPEGIEAVIAHLRAWPGFADLEVKYSTASSRGFLRMKVRLKAEIVTMGKTRDRPGPGYRYLCRAEGLEQPDPPQ